jgi:hypothetical protein
MVKLSSKRYDMIWWVAVLISVAAVIIADGNYQSTKSWLPLVLGAAISIATFLALFVKKETADRLSLPTAVEIPCEAPSGQTTVTTREIEPLPANSPVHPQSQDENVRVWSSVWSSQKRHDEFLNGARILNLYLKHAASQSGDASQIWLEQTQRILKQVAVLDQRLVSRRRNVLAEACEIAKKLHGTNVEIAVSPDDHILIRERPVQTALGHQATPEAFFLGKDASSLPN